MDWRALVRTAHGSGPCKAYAVLRDARPAADAVSANRGGTMKESENVKTVQAIYAAFGRGDGAFILERLAPDVSWDYGHIDAGIPWLTPRRGTAGTTEFFRSLAGLQIRKFEVSNVLGAGPLVLALIHIEATVQSTGQHIVDPGEVHIWHFDAHGKVERFRHAADTLQHFRALGL